VLEPDATARPPAFRIQGRDVGFPVVVRDASSGAATFLVSAAAARRLLPGPEIDVAEVWPGRALLSLAVIDYRDNDLGDYNEVSIAFFVRRRGEAGGIPYLGSWIDMTRGRLGTYIHRLPVDQAFTREAGETIWGFPKTVQQIDFEYAGKRARCRLVYDGEHALTLSLPRGGTKVLPEKQLVTYSFIEGVAHATGFSSAAEGFGVQLGGAELTLGSGPVADELRALGLPRRALLCTWMEHMRGSFGPARKLS
jgi:hypothetical protein